MWWSKAAWAGGALGSRLWLGGAAAVALYGLKSLEHSYRGQVFTLCQDRPARRPVRIHLTGFGPFGGIEDNPTSVVCRVLKEFVREGKVPAGVPPGLLREFADAGIALDGLEALEVSAAACRAGVRAILGRSGDSAACAIVHMGVSSASERVHLECRGFNVADFRIPDVRGWQPRGEQIVGAAEPQLYTSLPLLEILGEMHDRGVDCAISTDPGRYICNYIFYSSLHAAQASGTPVLFVHMPSFERMEQAVQVTAVLCMLLAVARQLRRGGLRDSGVPTSADGVRIGATSRPLG